MKKPILLINLKKVEECDKDFLMSKLYEIQECIRKTYPEQDSRIIMMITKICSFRNLFKNSRYAGFHHDRELETILKYKNKYPEFDSLWKCCFEIRKEKFDKRFLGELNDWNGIRIELKKYWLKYGLTCAEENINVDNKFELF